MDTHVDKIGQDNSQQLQSGESQMQRLEGGGLQVIDNSREAKEATELEDIADNSSERMKLKAFQYMADNSPDAKEAAELQNKANNSPEGIELTAFQDMVNSRPEIMELKAFQDKADNYVINEEAFAQKKENKTGLPDDLKQGIEALSGESMDDVNVHYNSSAPSDLQAHAYTDGREIHLGPGQKKHLPHEAWHVVQQKKGKVSATSKVNGQPLNEDQNLEKEADQKGREAARFNNNKQEIPTEENAFNTSIQKANSGAFQLKKRPCGHESNGVIQRMVDKKPKEDMTSIEELLEYVYGTFVNNRFQTFEQAVQDAIKNNKFNIESMFFNLENFIKKGNISSAIGQIGRIIGAINEHEASHPSHPNPVWNSKKKIDRAVHHESPFTITKTPKSAKIAKEMQELILSENVLKKGDKYQETKTEQCMLGVLVLPSGKLIVGLSGAGKRFADKIEQVLLLSKKKYPLLNNKIYTTNNISEEDETSYNAVLTDKLRTKDKFEKDENEYTEDSDGNEIRNKNYQKVVRTRRNKADQGSFAANCAASVVLSVAKGDGQNEFKGKKKLGLTEVWLSPNAGSEVIIYNQETADGDNFNRNHDDVPSCHVCQMQLDEVAREVVLLERNNVFENLNQELCKVENENKEDSKAAKQLEDDILGIELSKEQQEALNILVDQEKELEGNLDEIQKKLSAKESRLLKFNEEIDSLKGNITALNKVLKKDKGALNQKKNKHNKIKDKLADKTEQEKKAKKVEKLYEDIELLKEAKRELEDAKEVNGWIFTSIGSKSVEEVRAEIQAKWENDEEHDDLFNEYHKGKKKRKGKKKDKDIEEFGAFTEDQIGAKQVKLDKLNGEEELCFELEAEITNLEREGKTKEADKSEFANKLKIKEGHQVSTSKDIDDFNKIKEKEEENLKVIKEKIEAIKLEIGDDSNQNIGRLTNRKLSKKKQKRRSILQGIEANEFKIKNLKMSIKITGIALDVLKDYGKEIDSSDSDESIEPKSKDDTSTSKKEKKNSTPTRKEEISSRREQLEVLVQQIQKSKSKISVQESKESKESDESEESKEPYKDEVEEEVDLQNVPLWYCDDNGDVALNPESFPLFKTAYLNDVVRSSAYLTEAEGAVLANDLGISLTVIEGSIDRNEYHVIRNTGHGDCLIHTLVAAQYLLENDYDPFSIEDYDADNIEDYREMIAQNITNEQLEMVIIAAMFGNEPGMGDDMRNLIKLADLTKKDFSKEEKSKEQAIEKKKIKKKPKKEQQEQEVVELPSLGNGRSSDILFAHHQGLHWQLIVKKTPKKKKKKN